MCALVDVNTVLLKGNRLTVQESKVLHHVQDKHSLSSSTKVPHPALPRARKRVMEVSLSKAGSQPTS